MVLLTLVLLMSALCGVLAWFLYRSLTEARRLAGQLAVERELRKGFQRAMALPLHDDTLMERELWARAQQGDPGAIDSLAGYYQSRLMDPSTPAPAEERKLEDC